MPETVSRELALAEYLRLHVPQVEGQLDARDVLILRAVWQARRGPAKRLPQALAEATGIDRDDVDHRLQRMATEQWLQRLYGYSLTHRARALQTLLWVCADCGCTDEHACGPKGCWWIREDQCSACTIPQDLATELRLQPPIRFPRRDGGLA